MSLCPPTLTVQHRMKAVMTTCFQSVRNKLSHKLGYFDLLGFDFMLDAELNVSRVSCSVPRHNLPLSPNVQLWLIEVNVNPALHTNCSTLQSIVPPLVEETLGTSSPAHSQPVIIAVLHISLDIAVEVFDKCRHAGHSLLPLSSMRDFTLLQS